MSERRCELRELTDIEEHSVKAAENEQAKDEPHKFLWSKFWTAIPPLLVLSQILTLASNHFLGATTFMTVLSVFTILCVTFGIVGLGVGMGAIFRDSSSRTSPRSPEALAGSFI